MRTMLSLNRNWLRVCAVILFAGSVLKSFAADPIFVGRWPAGNRGIVQRSQVVGNLAYCAIRSGGLAIIDVSNAQSSTWVGGCDTPGTALDVAVSGNYAYVADLTSLRIVDVSNTASPVIIGSYTNCDRIKAVAASGNYAYVADGTNGVKILDVSDHSSPVLVGQKTTTNGFAEGITVTNNVVYLAMGNAGMLLIDVSNPATPVLTGQYNTTGYARRVAVSGTYAYIADGNGGLKIVDVSTPTNPVLVSTFATTGNAFDVVVSGSYAYVSESTGVEIVSIAAPEAPTVAGNYDSIDWTTGVSIVGNTLYVADGPDLDLIDVTAPSSPALIGTFTSGGNAVNVAVAGNRAYVSDSLAGIHVIDVGNPANMIRVAQVTNRSFGLALQGTNLFVASENGGVDVFGATGTMPHLSNFDTRGYTYSVATLRNFVVAADGSNCLETLDLSDVQNPVHLGHYITTTNGLYYAVVVAGNRAYVADGAKGLHLIDITDPNVPRRVGGVVFPNRCEAVVVQDNYAYVGMSNTVKVIDVTTTNPVVKGTYTAVANVSGIALAGTLAYVTEGTNGLEVVDVSNPTNCVRVGSYNAGGNAEKVCIAGNYAYVADSVWGLLAFQIYGSGNDAPRLLSNPQPATVLAGSTISFAVSAQGSDPLQYQWTFNGTNIATATASVLTLTNVSLADVGNYSVMVSNNWGTVQSSDAALQLIVSPQFALTNSFSGTNTFRLGTATQPDVSYIVEYCNGLGSPWNLLRVVNGTGAVLSISDTNAVAANRFYRIRIP